MIGGLVDVHLLNRSEQVTSPANPSSTRACARTWPRTNRRSEKRKANEPSGIIERIACACAGARTWMRKSRCRPIRRGLALTAAPDKTAENGPNQYAHARTWPNDYDNMVQVIRPSRATATATGRPSSYSDAVATEILERLSCGESLRSICGDNSMPDRSTVARWIANDAGFRARYDVARQLQEDAWRDEIRDLAKSEPRRDPKTGRVDADAVRHIRNQVGTLQWLVTKLGRKRV